MEAVRERSGVGKATIYRRYGSKEELVRAAIAHLNADIPLPRHRLAARRLRGDRRAVLGAAPRRPARRR